MMELVDSQEYLSSQFTDITLIEGRLCEAEFDGCTFTGCDFSSSVFERCSFIDCHFVKCNLSNMDIHYSRFNDVQFESSKLVGVDWTRATWPSIVLSSPFHFDSCIVNDCSFYGLESAELVLRDCKAHEVDFREGNFSESVFSGTDFTGSLFRKSNLTSTDFVDALNYDIDIYVNELRNARFSRHEAVRLLDYLDIELVD